MFYFELDQKRKRYRNGVTERIAVRKSGKEKEDTTGGSHVIVFQDEMDEFTRNTSNHVAPEWEPLL